MQCNPVDNFLYLSSHYPLSPPSRPPAQVICFLNNYCETPHHSNTNNSIRSFFQLVGDLSELYEKQVGTVSATHHPPLSRLFIFYMTPFSLIVKWYLQQWLRLSSRSTSSVSETTSASADTSSSSGLSQSEILVRLQSVHLPPRSCTSCTSETQLRDKSNY